MADGGDEGGECVKRVLKIFAILLLILAMGLVGLYGFIWYQFHHYWEAEPKVEPVWEIAGKIHIRFIDQQPLPRSLDELLADLDPAQLAKIRNYPMIWQPDSDPIFLIRINEEYGFAIDRRGRPSWLWEAAVQDGVRRFAGDEREQVSKYFPNY